MDCDISTNKSSELKTQKVLLIDLENCPSQLDKLPADLAHYLQVVICYATSNSKLPLDWLVPLSSAISANKLKIIKMEYVSKNSADFGICFLAGSLMQELPKETHFVILSNDKDLDHTVHLLRSHGRSSERIGNRKEEKEQLQSRQDIKQDVVHPTAIGIYCAHLITCRKARPAQAATLLNSIRSKFQDNPSLADPIYQTLISSGVIKITEKKVVYNDKKIQELAGQG
jgi:PIN domain